MKVERIKNFKNYSIKKNKKRFIVLHHTASSNNISGIISHWKSKPYPMGTAYIIDREGTIYNVFPSDCWAYHLGAKLTYGSKLGFNLERQSVGIELVSWGWLTKDGKGNYYSWANKLIDKQEVIWYPNGFRGYKYFHKYTEKQLNSLRKLLIHLMDKFNIENNYFLELGSNFDKVLKLEKSPTGIYSHTNFRTDKSDVHPQKELIELIRSL